MNGIVIVCAVISAVSALLLIIFALFVIGFLIGYKHEEKKILSKTHTNYENGIFESEQEKKSKEEWKNFLKYDGSAPNNR